MENTKKITTFLLVVIYLFVSCKKEVKIEEQKIKIKDPSLVIKDSTGNYLIKISNFSGRHLVNKVYDYTNNMSYNVSKKVDFRTFQKIESTLEYKNNVTDYYKNSSTDIYYIDTNYIYVYIDKEFRAIEKNPLFFIAGSSNNFKALGGNYLRIDDKVYCSGREIKNIDVNSFTTINLLRRKSPYVFSIGTDGKYLYTCSGRVFTKKELLHYYHVDEPILKKYYGKAKSKK